MNPNRIALAVSVAALAFIPSAMAVCGIGYVNGVPQEVCYDDGGGTGGGGGGTGGGDSGGGSGGGAGEGGGGGGIGSGTGVWVTVPGFPGVRINLLKKEVETVNLSCDDEEILRQREMQVVVIKNPTTAVTSSQFTLIMTTTGQTQKFWRATTSGSIQMFPTTGCQ